MAVAKTNAKPVARRMRSQRQLNGAELALLLRKADSAKSPGERKRRRREFMRGFYGDSRADAYAKS